MLRADDPDREPSDDQIAGASLLVDGLSTLGQVRDLLAARWGAKKVRRIAKTKRKKNADA